MKIIIDIPEKVVTAIQNGEDYRYDIHTAIAQGIPYEERPQVTVFAENASKEEIEDFKDELEGVLERPQNKWISVSEGLPNLPDRYLVTTRYDEVMTDYFTGHHFLQGEDIIAWQPLPEPYKRGEE